MLFWRPRGIPPSSSKAIRQGRSTSGKVLDLVATMTNMDHFLEAQRAAEAHIEACWAYLHDEDPDDPSGPPEPDMMAPFCGCLTCEVREILHAAMPHLRAGIAAGD